jgi:hypothetical protein
MFGRGCLLIACPTHRLYRTLSLAVAPPAVGAAVPCNRSERKEEPSADARSHSEETGEGETSSKSQEEEGCASEELCGGPREEGGWGAMRRQVWTTY